MKHNCMTILKVSVALILALMMVVGSISTVVAATITIEQSDSAADTTSAEASEAPAAGLVDRVVGDVNVEIADATGAESAGIAPSANLSDRLLERVKDIAGTGAQTNLAATSAANVDLYSGTSISNCYWVQNISLSNNSATFTRDLSANTTYYLYFKEGSNNYYGGNWLLPNDIQYTMGKYNNDNWNTSCYFRYTTTDAGTYTFTVSLGSNDGTIKIAGGSGGGESGESTPTPLYFYGNFNGKDGWSGDKDANQMTWVKNEDGYDYYKYESLTGARQHWVKFYYDSNIFSAASDNDDVTLSPTPQGTYQKDGKAFTYTTTASASYVLWAKAREFNNNTEDLMAWVLPYEATHDVAFSAGTGGSISPSGSVAVGETTATTVTATPSAGYDFTGWTLGNGITCADSSSSTISITAAASGTYTVHANFTAKPVYPITVTTNNASYGTASANLAYAYQGQTVTLTSVENTGTFSSWSVISGGVTVTNNQFTMPAAAVKVKAMFNAYSGTSKYYYDGWKNNDSNQYAVSAGNDWNNVRMSEAKYNGQRYAYFHATAARPNDSNYNKFSVSQKESGTRYVYFNDHGSWNDGGPWRSSTINKVAVFLDINGHELSNHDMEWISGEGDAVDKLWKIDIPNDERIYQVYFTNGKSGNDWRRTEYTNIDHGLYERSSWSDTYSCYSVNWNNGWGTSYTDAGGLKRYYWGSPSGVDQTYESDGSSMRFGSDIALNYADIGSYTGNTSMVYPVDAPTDYYIIVYYPNTDYGTINGVTANNTNSYPIVVASTDLPGGSANTVKVYAKDGAIRDNYVNYSSMADTKIYDSDNVAVGTGTDLGDGITYETYTATKGETITIKTTISDSYGIEGTTQKYSDQYYVRGFMINGEVPSGTLYSGKTDNNVYTVTYTIPEDFTGKYVEITPVYYLTDTINNQTVTFYIDGFTPALQQVGDDKPNWGNTIYAYPFYSTLHGTNNAFGKYPGQPMIYYNGTYSLQIPIYCTSPFAIDSGDEALLTSNTDAKKQTQRRAIRISGITLHNGYYDTVHRTVMGYKYSADGGNEQYKYQTQTYDYDDFYKIYHEKDDVDNIVFQFKNKTYSEGTDNLSLLSSFTPGAASTFTTKFGDDFEDLVNFHGRKVNIYGNAISGTALTNNPIYVVSKAGGAKANNDENPYVENIAGRYATEWVIYKPSAKTGAATYTMVTGGGKSSIPPSLLLLNSENSFSNTVYPSAVSDYNTTDWVDFYKALDSYKDYPVKITYEEAKSDVQNDKATRSDGRWLYSKFGENITGKIKVEVCTTANGTEYEDNATAATPITGLNAAFTNADASGLTTYSTTIDPDKTFNYNASSSNPDYIFEGWYLNDNLITKNNSGNTERTGNYTFVARFRYHTSGYLQISHQTEKTADYKGSGSTTMSVVVYDSDGVVKTNIVDTSDSVTLPAGIIDTANSNYRIKISLTSTPSGDNKFEKVHLDNTGNASITGAFFGGSLEYTSMPEDFEFTVGDLFSGDAQTVKQLIYKSNFSAPTYNYQIKYEYVGKLFDDGGDRVVQSFIKKGTMTPAQASDYITKDGANRILSAEFINNIAPCEENYGEVKTWTVPAAAYRTFNAVEGVTNTYSLDMTGDNSKVSAVQSIESDMKSITFELPYFFDSAGRAKINDVSPFDRTDSAYAKDEDLFTTVTKNYVLSVPYAKVPKPRYNTLSETWTQHAKDVKEVNDEEYVIAPETLKVATPTITTDESTDPSSGKTTYTTRVTYPSAEQLENATVKHFQYWRVFSNKDSIEVARCYTNKFTFAALGDYTITPIYEEQTQQNDNPTTRVAATINYLGPSRNQWNYGGYGNAKLISAADTEAVEASDLIFEDFVCAYYYNGEKINDGHLGDKVTTGYIVQRLGKLDTFEDGTPNTSREYYEAKYASDISDPKDTNKVSIKTHAAAGAGKYNGGRISVVTFNSTSLDNKDRIQNFYSVYNSVGWDNEDADRDSNLEEPTTTYPYKDYAYRAFAFINDNGTVTLCDTPVYFTMYDIATQ